MTSSQKHVHSGQVAVGPAVLLLLAMTGVFCGTATATRPPSLRDHPIATSGGAPVYLDGQ